MEMINELCYEINNLVSISGKYTSAEFDKALYILEQKLQPILDNNIYGATP